MEMLYFLNFLSLPKPKSNLDELSDFCHGAFFMGQIHPFLMHYDHNVLDIPLEF